MVVWGVTSRFAHSATPALQVTLSGEYLNEHANFRTMQAAVLLLFRCVTGESWNGIMHDCMVDARLNPNRCSDEAGDCGSPPAALIYFISFALVGSFVMLNLVIAVILENFSAIGSEEDLVVPDEAIEQVAAQSFTHSLTACARSIVHLRISTTLHSRPPPCAVQGRVGAARPESDGEHPVEHGATPPSPRQAPARLCPPHEEGHRRSHEARANALCLSP